MAIPIHPVPRFPIDPSNSAQEMQKLSDALEDLQRTVSNYLAPWPVNAPRPSLPVVVKITGTTISTGGSSTLTLGTGWYSGKMQLPPQQRVRMTGGFDPATSATPANIYTNKNTSDDCYVLATGNATLTTSLYYLGELQGLANPSSSQFPVRPVLIVSGVGSALPTGTGQWKVLMLTDNLNPGTPGWDFPRLH